MPTKVSHETRPPMTPFAADLFDEMQILNRRVQRYAACAHLHWCACGDAYVCTQERDKCEVPTEWTCVACELERER
jgi:hypothetical protein